VYDLDVDPLCGEPQFLGKLREPGPLCIAKSQGRPRRRSMRLLLQPLAKFLGGLQQTQDLPVHVPQDGFHLLLGEEADHLRRMGAVTHDVARADHSVGPMPVGTLKRPAERGKVGVDIGKKYDPHGRPLRQAAVVRFRPLASYVLAVLFGFRAVTPRASEPNDSRRPRWPEILSAPSA
jgi:hypothetical protein